MHTTSCGLSFVAVVFLPPPFSPSTCSVFFQAMPLRLTSAPVAGIQKRKSTAASKSRASPFGDYRRQKSKASANDDGGAKSDQQTWSAYADHEQLADVGVSHYIAETSSVNNVKQAIRYIGNSMFEDIPAQRAGMSSTRIAQVLNMRRSLPPLVSVAHVHTLFDEPTRVEKEIVNLVNAGRVRRVIIPGRGNDTASLGDCLVLSEDWEDLVRRSGLEQSVKGKVQICNNNNSSTHHVRKTASSRH